jgi:phosphate transport system permease protein
MKAAAGLERYTVNLTGRRRAGIVWRSIFLVSTIVGVIALTTLVLTIINGAFGYVALEARVDPATLAQAGVAIESQSKDQLVALLQSRLSAGALKKLESQQPFERRSRSNVYGLVLERIVRYDIVGSWTLWESFTDAEAIHSEVQQEFPDARLTFRAWLNPRFVTGQQTSEALTAGVRTAILGTLWTMLFTIVLAFPLGVGAAIYLEEYAGSSWVNRFIQTNINNLAGVPSIVYGMLGLAIFVRALEPLTSGAFFRVADPTTANGRTVLSAGLTLGVLVLPIIIINAQEAIRAVPRSLRNASYGLGATKWETIWHHVLPSALPGILTGTILAISRAIGETAPLVVIGASTAISFDPTSPFSKFTTLPIQIYQWTSRPQAEFRSLAAAAIVVLLIMLLSLNAAAILLRNRYSRRA